MSDYQGFLYVWFLLNNKSEFASLGWRLTGKWVNPKNIKVFKLYKKNLLETCLVWCYMKAKGMYDRWKRRTHRGKESFLKYRITWDKEMGWYYNNVVFSEMVLEGNTYYD